MDDVKLLRQQLWANGYRPISILTGQKRPYRDNYIERAMKNPPEAVSETVYPFCASTAILCYGLRALDLDIDDPKICESVQVMAHEIFGVCPVRYRSDSPRRLFLYKDSSCATTKKFITFENGQQIEILGCRQKFLAFGQHEKGAQYQWFNDYSPLSIRLEDLIEFDESKIDLFREKCALISPVKKAKEPYISLPAPDIRLEPGHLRSYALGALQSIEKELAQCVKGGRNNLLNSSAFRLGSLSARGWLQLDECQISLKNACDANGLIKESGIHAWIKTFQSGWCAGLSKPADTPRDTRVSTLNFSKVDICQGLLDTYPKGTDSSNMDTCQEILDNSLTYVPGILGQLVDWITETGSSGNRWISLSGALALFSLLLGRNIATPTEGSLDMYIILTAPTGSGKGHPPRAINSLISALKLERHMGDDEFKSGAYIEDLIQNKPLCLSIQDEFGQILSQITAHNAPLNMSQVSTNLRKLWGRNFDTFRTGGARSRPSIAVHAPHLTIYGLSTSHQLFSAVKSKDISNGVMNRFLLIDGGNERMVCEKIDRPSVKAPPPDLIRDLYRLYMIGAPRDGNLAGLYDKNFNAPPEIFKVPWDNENARSIFSNIQNECFDIISSDPEMGEIYARTAFYSIKLATLVACGEDLNNPRVTVENMEWGGKIAKMSSDLFFQKAKENMSETLAYSEIFKKIISLLSNSNPEGLPPKSMQRRKLFDRIKNYCNRSASDPSNCLRELERNEIVICHVVGKISVVTLLPKS